MRQHRPVHPASRQRGAVLFIALILLLILTLLGVTAARMQTGEEMMAMNDDNHQLALQTSEAVLRQVEDQLNGSQFPQASFQLDSAGAYDLTVELNTSGSSVTDTLASLTTAAVPYTGPALTNVPVPTPKFVVESMPPVCDKTVGMPSGQYGNTQNCTVTRVTALAQGGDGSSRVTAQSIYH